MPTQTTFLPSDILTKFTNLQLEKQILALCYFSSEHFIALTNELTPTVFSDRTARFMWEIFLNIRQAGLQLSDVIIFEIADKYETNPDKITKDQLQMFLLEMRMLKQEVDTNCKQHFMPMKNILLNNFHAREIVHLSNRHIELIKSDLPLDVFLEQHRQLIHSDTNLWQKAFSTVTLHTALQEWLDVIAQNNPQINGLQTTYPVLDRKLGGLQKGELIVIAARPSVGKSAFALNIATRIAKQYLNTTDFVLYCSFEMPYATLSQRVLASEVQLELTNIRTNRLDELEKATLREYVARSQFRNFYIYDNAIAYIEDIEETIEKLCNNLKPMCVIIDYLQLMHVKNNNRENRQGEIAALSSRLKLMAVKFEIPFIVLSQLSRASEKREDKHPMLSDLRDSGAIEQDADKVLFLYRDDYYQPTTNAIVPCEVIIAKNRNGETGRIMFNFIRPNTSFYEISEPSNV